MIVATTTNNSQHTPSIGDKVSILGQVYKVIDRILMVESNTWYLHIVPA